MNSGEPGGILSRNAAQAKNLAANGWPLSFFGLQPQNDNSSPDSVKVKSGAKLHQYPEILTLDKGVSFIP